MPDPQSAHAPTGAPAPEAPAAATGTRSDPDLSTPGGEPTKYHPGGVATARPVVLPRRMPRGAAGLARPVPLSLTPLTTDLVKRIIAGLERL